MRTKITAASALMTMLFLVSTFALVLPAALADSTVTDTYVSDTSDQWWSGSTSADIDASGYIVPPGTATWQAASFCWEHSAWNSGLTPSSLKTKLFASPSADWIWGPVVAPDNKVSVAASWTGDIVFFKKQINIPGSAININGQLFIITADNGYYFYVNDDWSGTPTGSDGFATGYNPTNFYYTSDGVTNLGGGENSVPYETVGNLYPLDAAVPTTSSYWTGIEQWDITSLLQTGSNTLQIVAINEHAAPHDQTNNPAGLIYKVEVTYDMPSGLVPESPLPIYALISLTIVGLILSRKFMPAIIK